MPGWEEGDWRDESLCNFKDSNLLNSMGLEFYIEANFRAKLGGGFRF